MNEVNGVTDISQGTETLAQRSAISFAGGKGQDGRWKKNELI